MISSYIENIRKKIGHELLLLPAVTLLCFDAADKLLLLRHSDKNLWVTPGGMIEPDESPEEAGKREMLEETGCLVELEELVGVFGGTEFRFTYQNGDEVAYIMIAYLSKITGGSLQPDGGETLEARYFGFQEIKDLPQGPWLSVLLDRVFQNKRFRP